MWDAAAVTSPGVAGHIIAPRKTFAPEDDVTVANRRGWSSKIDRVPAVVKCATPQFGDTYLIEYADGKRDVVHVNRLEAA
jgi:hypothetical protein